MRSLFEQIQLSLDHIIPRTIIEHELLRLGVIGRDDVAQSRNVQALVLGSLLVVLCVWILLRLHRAVTTSPVTLTHAPHTVVVGRTSLAALVESCPSLGPHAEFRPTWWLPNGHLQTVLASVLGGRAANVNIVEYKRRLLIMPDGGTVSMDWCPEVAVETADVKKPIMVILHGLTGGSHELYVQELVKESVANGMNAVVVNSRGCANTKLTSPQLYSGAMTGDVRAAVAYIKRILPSSTLVGVGFSLGANMMTKFVGEDGQSSPFAAAVSVANPYDLLQCSHSLHAQYIGRHIYSPKMTEGLIQLFLKHKDVITSPKTHPFNVHAIKTARNLIEFDAECTSKAFGFRTVYEYYRRASSIHFIPDIAIPTLLLSAVDDPVVAPVCLPHYEARENPHVVLATTRTGGHIGWFQGTIPKRWCSRPIVEFCAAVVKAQKEVAGEVVAVTRIIKGGEGRKPRVERAGWNVVIEEDINHHSLLLRSRSPPLTATSTAPTLAKKKKSENTIASQTRRIGFLQTLVMYFQSYWRRKNAQFGGVALDVLAKVLVIIGAVSAGFAAGKKKRTLSLHSS